MKRLLPLLILALLAPSAAEAQRGDRGERGDRREARAERRWSDQGPPRGSERRWRERRPRPERRVEERRFDERRLDDRRLDDRRFDRPRDVGYRQRVKPGKGPKAGRDPGPPRRGYNRGQTMAPEFRGTPLTDYRRHRLRRPPPGYSYYQRGRDVYLVSDRTGMIFEVVPIGR